MNRKDFLESIRNNKKKNVSRKFFASKGTLEKTKNKIKNNKIRNKVAIALAGLTLLGFSGCNGTRDPNQPQPTQPSTSVSETITKPVYCFSNGDEVLQDYKTRYLEEYNKANGTSISPSEIKLLETTQQTLYRTFDDQYVTHGSYPYETRKVLNKYGDYSVVSTGNYKLIQVLLNDKPLETFIDFYDQNGNSISTSVLSGNDLDSLLENLENNKGKEETTLGNMVDLAKAAIATSVSYHDVNPYILKYENAVIKYDETKKGVDDPIK